MTVQELLTRFPHQKSTGGQWLVRCPAHQDDRESLAVREGDDGRVLLKCHAHCTTESIVAALGIEMVDLFPPRAPKPREVAAYDYRDEHGVLLYQVVRFEPKDFRQRRPDSSGGWTWKLDGVRRVLYGLQQVFGDVVFVAEGEKDVEALRALALTATTNAGGAGKWRPEYTEQLVKAGVKRVYVLPDNDDAGRQHAELVARSCQDAGLLVKVITLPALKAKGDVSDYIAAGHGRDDLLALVESTPVWGTAPAPKPQPDACALRELLVEMIDWVRRYVVVSDAQATAIVLWAAHTHAIDAFDCTPYLQITSATKRAGKTRLLEVLEPVVARPWFTGRTSAAALVRKVHKECPTLLLDESDAAFGGDKEYAEALRGQLNTGYRRSGKSTVCTGQSSNITVVDFCTFSPKAIAGIGDLPSTIADRCISIQLRRKTSDEPCERWRERTGREEGTPFRDGLADWGESAVDVLRDARPELPSALGDRQADVWEPLLAIADLAGGAWPAKARHAAAELSGTLEDTDITIELLKDISEIVTDDGRGAIPTKELLEKLVALEDRPWATWSHGKAITPHKLTRMLGPLGIHPDRHLRTCRGYRVDAFAEAIARYLPNRASHRHRTNENGPELAETDRRGDSDGDALKIAKTNGKSGHGDTVTLPKPGAGGLPATLFAGIPGAVEEVEL